MRSKATTRRALTSAVPALVLATGLVACTSDGKPDDSNDRPLAEYLGEDAVEFSPQGGASVFVGIDRLLGQTLSPEEVQLERDLEELIAECMREQGFEYTPHVNTPPDSVTDLDLPDREYTAKHGYGMAIWMFGDPNEPEDPNQEFRSALSEKAQDEYDVALDGDESGDKPGCYRQASSALASESDSTASPVPRFSALEQDIRDLGYRIAGDPRLDEPRQAWRDCMADAGYPGLIELWDGSRVLDEYMIEEFDGYAEWLDENIADGKEVDEYFELSPSQYRILLEFEIALATTDLDCVEKHFIEAFEQVRHELETEFVEQHRSELEQARDDMANAEAP